MSNDKQTIINDIVKSTVAAHASDLAESDDAQDILASQEGACIWRGHATVREGVVAAAIYDDGSGGDGWAVWSVRDDGEGAYLVKGYHRPTTAEIGTLLASALADAEALEGGDVGVTPSLVDEGAAADCLAWDLVVAAGVDAEALVWVGTEGYAGCAGWDIYDDGVVIGGIRRTRDGRVQVSAYGADHMRAIEVIY
jgi:hypothetical protein